MKYKNDRLLGYRLGSMKEGTVPEIAAIARAAVAEGSVLLKNERDTLPLISGDRVALFGRGQYEYCKSGTGSGGLVHCPYETNIYDSLKEHTGICIDAEVSRLYADFIRENPFDKGTGWAKEPWCQKELPLSEDAVTAARARTDKAVIIITRTAGEDRDNTASRGSWYLTEEEENTVRLVTAAYDKVAVVLNVGNIMDLSFTETFGVEAVLFVWQGGMEGGRAAADVLTGVQNPSGKLTDTIARSIDDYPARAHFGDAKENIYTEDIFVGYRYFETFAKERVLYPFGYGISYTTFALSDVRVRMDSMGEDTVVRVDCRVKNTGKRAGREVVQVYLGAPQGKLGKPEKLLAAFRKTVFIAPGKTRRLSLAFRVEDYASYDDGGYTGNQSCYVLEAGQYIVYVGTDARSAEAQAAFFLEEKVVSRCEQVLAPTVSFERLTTGADGEATTEPVPTAKYSMDERIRARMPEELPRDGGEWTLRDVAVGNCSLEMFVSTLSDEELITLVRGEGMNSPKVTPGTGSCFGGVTRALSARGIPIACTTDGPSGLRFDAGMPASSLPNGTLLACTWNPCLVYSLYVYEGIELTAYRVDLLLGPGINIHRDPLCGRNFEYFSEDPLISGTMAAGISAALAESGVYTTIKHFACNNQEWHRTECDSVVSERALREIYLKPFEIAVRDGGALAIMTSYNFVNGLHAAANYDLTETVLRGEWGYSGIVMTDWWAHENRRDEPQSRTLRSRMVRAAGDLYMVTQDSEREEDDLKEALASGDVTRAELQRSALRILRFLLGTHAYERFVAEGGKYPEKDRSPEGKKRLLEIQPGDDCAVSCGNVFRIAYRAEAKEVAQIPVTVNVGGARVDFEMIRGTEGADGVFFAACDKDARGKLTVFTPSSGLTVLSVEIYG